MYIHFFLSYYMYLDSANVIMGTDHGETFDPLKQIGIFGIAFLIINAVLFVSTLIFFYFTFIRSINYHYKIAFYKEEGAL